LLKQAAGENTSKLFQNNYDSRNSFYPTIPPSMQGALTAITTYGVDLNPFRPDV